MYGVIRSRSGYSRDCARRYAGCDPPGQFAVQRLHEKGVAKRSVWARWQAAPL